MLCPACGKEIDYVGVYSHCTQKGTLGDDGVGNVIVSYDDTEVQDTISINCPECDEDIQGSIVES